MTTKIDNQSAIRTIKLLRRKKFKLGLPFMINSSLLPSNQCYLEFPDGSMQIVEANSKGSDFKIIEKLDHPNTELLKRSLKLI